MDKTFSDEEKLRRAIEISQRRNGYYNSNVSSARVNVNDKKDYRLFKKMILQIIICLLIYIIIHLINTTNYAFSDDVIKNTNNILSYDINIEKLYKDCQKFFVTIFNNNEDKKEEINNNTVENNVVNSNSNNIQENEVINNKIVNNTVVDKKENKEDKNNNLKEHDKEEKQADTKHETVEKTALETVENLKTAG